MQANVDKFKHFEIGPAEQEKLVEMWKYFHPKDDPQPMGEDVIYVSEKYPRVANHAFMEVLKYDVFQNMTAKVDRWQVKTQNICTDRPVDVMYQAFIDYKSNKEPRPKKPIEEESEKTEPAKKPRRK